MQQPLTLTSASAAIWRALAEHGPAEVSALMAATGQDQSQVALVAHEGQEAGFVAVEERALDEVDPAEDAAAQLAQGLPERRGARILAEAGGSLPMPQVVAAAKEAGIPLNEIVKWGQARGWIDRENGKPPLLRLTDAGRAALDSPQPDELAVQAALAGQPHLQEMGLDVAAVQELLARRPTLARLRPRVRRVLSLTPAGQAAWAAGPAIRVEKSQLSAEDLRSGAWREIDLRPYDVTLPGPRVIATRLHPVRRIIEQTRRAFLELGFEEVASPTVESAFWNFDALFQPQDHPARDMQDTFYMADPQEARLPDPAVVEAVRAAHENGGNTGSTGWGYRWSPDRARQNVLRTHTTAASIQALARHPAPPYKAFCVGWAYRNETLSYKHLPVFHQVDGIVIDEGANLATLLGTLSAFYRKMGFEKVTFKPAFYPYTEPSVDVMVYVEERGKWMEMGGSGIFRPEVTEPLGCSHPVLAWGLGVERLAMIKLGFSDIRELYAGGLDTVEGVALCR